MVTLEEMKNYLRVDYGDDDALIEGMISAAVKQCMDILRTDSEDDLAAAPNGIYNILGIDHQNFKKKSVKLKCQKVRR